MLTAPALLLLTASAQLNDGWTLEKIARPPRCSIERVTDTQAVVLAYSAVTESTTVVLATVRINETKVSSRATLDFVRSGEGIPMRRVTGYTYDVREFPNGKIGILLSSDNPSSLASLSSADSLTVLEGDNVIVSVNTPGLSLAISRLEDCAKKAKYEMLEQLEDE